MISVMMPVYNAEKFLEQAIESVLFQTYKDFELIIINDGSTDQSESIILSYKDPRIKYFKKENGGEATARNVALQHATGEFVVFQDADDVSLPTRFETLLQQFDRDEVGIAHSDLLVVDEWQNPVGYLQTSNILDQNLLRFFLKVGTPFNNPSMMVRRKLFEGFQYDVTLRNGTDTDMVFHTIPGWKTVHVPQPLMLYRRHSSNLTNEKSYDVLAKHVQKFIHEKSLEEFFPEIPWSNGRTQENQALAKALMYLFLTRRHMIQDGQEWFKEALEAVDETSVNHAKLIRAIGFLGTKEYERAQNILESITLRDHMVENYIGEAYAYLGDTNKAMHHFMLSLMIRPKYAEPMDNLKALGGFRNFHLVDNAWLKFRKG